jgi:GMP reductase
MRIESGLKIGFDDVLITPKRSVLSSRKDVKLARTFKNLGIDKEYVPVISANMDSVGTMAMAKVLFENDMLTALHKHYSVEDLVHFFTYNADMWDNVFYTLGISDKEEDKLWEVKNYIMKNMGNTGSFFPKMLCIDVANGYTESFLERIKRIKDKYPNSIIMAGNVVTPNMVEELILLGVQIVKVGIGSGSVCETRTKTGVGYPQLSAVIECADAAHGCNGLVCSDGGCRIPADVCKAFGGGSDFVMLGGMLSGTDECEGKWEYEYESEKKVALKFHGMSSREAQDMWNGGMLHYKASEGKEVSVEYKGPVQDEVNQILGGLRSACTYVGAKGLKSFSRCCTFIRVTEQENKVFSS